MTQLCSLSSENSRSTRTRAWKELVVKSPTVIRRSLATHAQSLCPEVASEPTCHPHHICGSLLTLKMACRNVWWDYVRSIDQHYATTQDTISQAQVWHGGQSFCVSPPNQSTPLSKNTLLISFDLSGPLDTLTRGAYSMSCNAPIFIIQPFRSANYPLPDFCLAWHFHLRTHFLKLFKSNSWVSLQLTQTNLHKEHVWIHTDHLRSYTSLALLLARCIILEKYLISLSQFLCMGIIIMCSPWCCFRD